MEQPTTPTVFEDPTIISGANTNRFAMDSKLFVEFSRKPRLQRGKSKAAGRAVYEEVDYIRVHVPGDKLSVVERPVDSIDRQRFADRYAKWQAGQPQAVTGTPISALPNMTPAKVEEYKYFKIITVEQLADAPDSVGQKFMSFNSDKRQAKVFLEVAKNNAPIEHMNEELKKRDAVIDDLKTELEAMKASKRKLAAAATAE